MTTLQEYLNQKYPNKLEVKEIIIKNKELEGTINFEGFDNLERLKIYDNEITHMHGLDKCTNLWEIYLKGNKLDNIDFLDNLPNPEKLTKLVLSNNNIKKNDLSIFSRFVNLKGLFIGNSDRERIERKIYNRFYGSLENLKLLTELESICIEATDIDEGLEHLSEKVRTIHSQTHGFDKKVKKIKELLKPYGFSIVKWRESKKKPISENELVQLVQCIEEQAKSVHNFPFLDFYFE